MQVLIQLGIFLIILGFLIIFIGILHEMLSRAKQSEEEQGERKTEAGGIILIGPIPIIFGTSKKIEKWMLIIALAIVIIMALLYILSLYESSSFHGF